MALSTPSGTWGVVRASLRFRALGPYQRLLGVDSYIAVAPVASGTMASATASPAAARGSRVLVGAASRLALTRNTSIWTSLTPDLVQAPPAVPPALTPTRVRFTIASVEGVADMVLF
jgi:hypothetical protein